jgi:hypothetical protein
MNWEAIGAIGEIVGAATVVAALFYLAIQGGAAMWPKIEVVITPTIKNLINDRLDQHPDDQSMIDLVPIFRINKTRNGAT